MTFSTIRIVSSVALDRLSDVVFYTYSVHGLDEATLASEQDLQVLVGPILLGKTAAGCADEREKPLIHLAHVRALLLDRENSLHGLDVVGTVGTIYEMKGGGMIYVPSK